MTIGDPNYFALESGITYAYERLSFRALRFFIIHVERKAYGVRAWNATMLAIAFDDVSKRIARRGNHNAIAFSFKNAEQIATAFSRAIYVQHEDEELFLGMLGSKFVALLYSEGLIWAPDGDEAFDDGSCVLHSTLKIRSA